MKKFRKFALVTTVTTYFLIFIGGLVRVAGAGLGCPDWPKCFGRWIPPTDISQLPPDMDPNLFNFTLAWIEYVNRLVGVTVGLLIATLAVWAIIKFREQKKIVLPSVAAALLVAFQGWQGSQVVASALEPFIITIHMTLALIIVSLLLYVYLQTYLTEHPDKKLRVPSSLKTMIGGLYVLTIFQIMVGTQIRSQIETIFKNSPLLGAHEVLELIGFITPFHIIVGLLLVLLAGALKLRLGDYKKEAPTKVVHSATMGFTILLAVQIVLGLVMVWWNLPALGRVLHLWLASFMIGCLLILYVFLGREGKTV